MQDSVSIAATSDSSLLPVRVSLKPVEKEKDTIQLTDFRTLIPQQVLHPDTLPLRPSMFTGHELRKVNQQPLPLKVHSNDWVFGLLLFAVFLLSMVKVLHLKKLKQYVKAFFTERVYSQLLREEHSVFSPVSLLLSVSALIVFSLFAYQGIMFFNKSIGGQDGFGLYLFVAGALLIVFLVKILLYRITGFILDLGKEITDFIFTKVLFVDVLAFVLIPLVLAIEYIRDVPRQFFFIAGGVAMVVSFLIRNYRGIILANSTGPVSRLYIILYLCALEILPLVVLIKLLSNRF